MLGHQPLYVLAILKLEVVIQFPFCFNVHVLHVVMTTCIIIIIIKLVFVQFITDRVLNLYKERL